MRRASAVVVAPRDAGTENPKSAIPPVHRVPIALARRFFQICTTVMADGALANESLTPLQFAVLAYLNNVTGEPDIDQNGLAARMGVDRSHASLLVEQLVVMGLVDRRANEADRRANTLRLTLRGEKLHHRLRPAVFEGQRSLLNPLSNADRELLLNLLSRVVEGNIIFARPGSGRRKQGPSQSPSSKK
jgi:DNA-binding MarR family transcriptional regulator